MACQLLDLPLEIRNMIYVDVLLSTTGYVTPIICKRNTQQQPGLRQVKGYRRPVTSKVAMRLHLIPIDPSLVNDSDDNKGNTVTCAYCNSDAGPSGDLPLAVHISRVCKQMRAETDGIFWRRNILYFPDLSLFRKYMKHMGQMPSRQIQKVLINSDCRDPNETKFRQAIKSLASRSRFGKLVKIAVAITSFDACHDACLHATMETQDALDMSLMRTSKLIIAANDGEWWKNNVHQELILDVPDFRESTMAHALYKDYDEDPTLLDAAYSQSVILQAWRAMWAGRFTVNGRSIGFPTITGFVNRAAESLSRDPGNIDGYNDFYQMVVDQAKRNQTDMLPGATRRECRDTFG